MNRLRYNSKHSVVQYEDLFPRGAGLFVYNKQGLLSRYRSVETYRTDSLFYRASRRVMQIDSLLFILALLILALFLIDYASLLRLRPS